MLSKTVKNNRPKAYIALSWVCYRQRKAVSLMNRTDIAKAIAEDLLNNDALDEHNFSYDTAAILEYVQNIILEHLKDYSLLSGTIF